MREEKAKKGADRNIPGLAVLLFFGLFLPSFVQGELLINEVMYAPTEEWGGSSNEWAELYNDQNESLNLSGCRFYGKELGEMVVEGDGFLIITREPDTFKETYGEDFLIIENSFERGLKNTGETMVLEGNKNCSNSFDYGEYTKLAKGNNKSLERREEGSWGESLREGGTPGEENSIFDVSLDYEPLLISEVMPDPFDKDDALKPKGEWIELYNPGERAIDLNGLYFEDESGHKLFITDNKVLSPTGLIIYPDNYTVVYRDGDSDFTLNNDGYEEVRLFFGEEEIDSMSYESSTEGMSWSNMEGDFFETPPTPDEINYLVEDCDWLLILDLDNAIYREKDLSFNLTVYRWYGFAQEITVKGKIEDVNGEVIREYTPWTEEYVVSEKSKKYSPNLGEGIYQVSFWFEGLECKEDDLTDNEVSRLIAINPEYQKFDSSLEIEKLYLGSDESAEWGEQFTVKVNVYKGNDSAYSVQLWAEKEGEKISKVTKLSLYDSYKNYPLSLPVQLAGNCNEKIKDGTAKLVLEAFGLRTEKEFEIEGLDEEVCKDYLDYVEELNKEEAEKKEKYQVLELPAEISAGEVLRVKVQLIGDGSEHDYKVWSYLYRGNKCYSCGEGEREDNQLQLRLGKNEVKQAEMLVKVDETIEEGEYKLKVKLNKDGQKTDKELTYNIYVKERGEKKETKGSLSLLGGGGEEEGLGRGVANGAATKIDKKKEGVLELVTGIVVYESSSEKAKELIPYLLLGVLGLVVLILLLKKI